MHPLLNIAIQAARQASKVLLRFMDRLESVKINTKGRNDFVTEVDHLSEQDIIQTIRRAYPDHAILGEESGYLEGQNEYCWIIDPLDGTMNYIHGIPHFCISIAVKQNDVLEAGVVYDPVRNELFSSAKGKGAMLNDRRIRVSPAKKLEASLIGTGFPFRDSTHLADYLKTFSAITSQCSGVRRPGSAALDLAYVAAGRFDGFWEPNIKPWDMAAGVLLVEQAGGMVGDFQGEKNYLDNGNIIAGNPQIYKAILDIIKAQMIPSPFQGVVE